MTLPNAYADTIEAAPGTCGLFLLDPRVTRSFSFHWDAWGNCFWHLGSHRWRGLCFAFSGTSSMSTTHPLLTCPFSLFHSPTAASVNVTSDSSFSALPLCSRASCPLLSAPLHLCPLLPLPSCSVPHCLLLSCLSSNSQILDNNTQNESHSFSQARNVAMTHAHSSNFVRVFRQKMTLKIKT